MWGFCEAEPLVQLGNPDWWAELGSWMCRLGLGYVLHGLFKLVVATSSGSLITSCWDAGCSL